MKNSVFTIILLLIALLSFIACGGNKDVKKYDQNKQFNALMEQNKLLKEQNKALSKAKVETENDKDVLFVRGRASRNMKMIVKELLKGGE